MSRTVMSKWSVCFVLLSLLALPVWRPRIS